MTIIIWVPRFRGPIDLRWDAGTYYVLGTALAQGKGYRLLNEPGEIESVQYPPLLPAIVAVHQWVLGTSDPMIVGHWLRVVFFLMSIAYALASYALLARVLPTGYAFVGVILCLLHLFSMFLSELLFAELPFALVSVLFALFAGQPGSRSHPILAAVCATVAYLLRTAGIALLMAWVGESVLRRDVKRAALRGAIAMLPILGWQAYIAGVQSSTSYATPAYPYQRADYMFYNVSYAANLSLRDPYRPELGKASLADLGTRALGNLRRLPRSLGEAVSAEADQWQRLLARVPGAHELAWERSGQAVTTFTVTLLGVLVLGGMAIQLARDERLGALYVLAYVGPVCLTPWLLQGKRYWSAVAPFLVLFLFQCLLTIRSHGWLAGPVPVRVVARALVPAVVCIVLVVELFTVLRAYRTHRGDVVLHDRRGSPVEFSLFYYTGPDRELDEALEWLRARARPTDIVAAAMPHWAHLVTGVKTVMPPFEADPRAAEVLLDAVPVRYIVMDDTLARLMRRSTLEIPGTGPARWTRIHTGPSGLVTVYERVSETTAGTAVDSAKPGR